MLEIIKDIFIGRITQTQHHDGFNIGPETCGMRAFINTLVHPCHRSVKSCFEPRTQLRVGLRNRIGCCHAKGIKAFGFSFGGKCRFEIGGAQKSRSA
jgi:hypothetical protein